MSPSTLIDFLFVDQKLGDFNYFDLTTLNAINRQKICQQDIFYHDFSTYLSRIVNITSTSRYPFKRISPSQRNKWRHVNVSVVIALSRYRVIALSRYRLVNGSRKLEHLCIFKLKYKHFGTITILSLLKIHLNVCIMTVTL